MVNGESLAVNGESLQVKPLSQAAIGRALGLAPATMTKLKGQGMPVDSVESARAWREARQNIAARKPEPQARVVNPGNPLGLTSLPRPPSPEIIRANEVKFDGGEMDEAHDEARTRREIAEANMAEMKEGELRGDLIRVSAVKATLAVVFATTRDALLQIPARLAPLLAADTDPASVQNMLHAEIHQALQQLAGASERVGQSESASI
jgi:phage terminase Nu1 subunit (DNA packaging protein)